MKDLNGADQNLIELGQFLLSVGYTFTTVTPATHKRVLRREQERHSREVRSENPLRDFFGWNKGVPVKLLPSKVIELLETSKLVAFSGDRAVSKVRFSTLDGLIFMHSGFPTSENDSVFFGPDSYRFVRLLKQMVKSANKIIDVGAGSGVGGMGLAHHLFETTGVMPELVLSDINGRALRYSRINLAINGFTDAMVVESNILSLCPDGADVVIANPPFIIDESKRMYRHGGENYGAELSARIVKESLEYLDGRGQLVVYTGSCVVGGRDQFFKAIEPLIREANYEYTEIDPDIFGEQLSLSAYADVERTAAVALVVRSQEVFAFDATPLHQHDGYLRQLGQTP